MTKAVMGGTEFLKDLYIYQWKHVEPGEIAQADSSR